jgi:omega-amidase
MPALRVAIIQTSLFWEDPGRNFHMLERKLEAAGEADLIVLPEMFATGFSMSPEKYADKSEDGLKWMVRMSEKYGTAIIGSLMTESSGQAVNRLYFTEPDGNFYTYDKRHLFSMGQEHLFYRPGKKRLILEYRGWKICPLVCYDLRFPVFSRNDADYDLLVYVASWPEKRAFQWKSLCVARAIENQAYLLACNRTGTDGNGLDYSGDSMILDFQGTTLSYLSGQEGVLTSVLDLQPLKKARETFAVLQDRDSFEADWK